MNICTVKETYSVLSNLIKSRMFNPVDDLYLEKVKIIDFLFALTDYKHTDENSHFESIELLIPELLLILKKLQDELSIADDSKINSELAMAMVAVYELKNHLENIKEEELDTTTPPIFFHMDGAVYRYGDDKPYCLYCLRNFGNAVVLNKTGAYDLKCPECSVFYTDSSGLEPLDVFCED